MTLVRSHGIPTIRTARKLGPSAPDRNLALELARVTEAAALAAARWVGRATRTAPSAAGPRCAADQHGLDERRGRHRRRREGSRPDAVQREQVGDGTGPDCDVAVDPIDGTRLTAGTPSAVAVIALSARGSMHRPTAVFYMSKLVAGPEAADVVDTTRPRPPRRRGPGQAVRAARRDRRHPGPAPARRAASPRSASGSADQADPPTVTWQGDPGRPRRHRRRICCSVCGTPRHHRGLRDQVHRRNHPRQAGAA